MLETDHIDVPQYSRSKTPSPAADVALNRPASPRVLVRRSLAFFLPLLALCSATVTPVAVDIFRLWFREASLTWPEKLHAAVFALGLMSMAGLLAGVIIGAVLTLLTRRQDLSQSTANLVRAVRGFLAEHNRRPESVAWSWAGLAGLALVLMACYKVNYWFFTTFNNYSLAALLLACLFLVVLATAALAAATLRVGLVHVVRALARVPVLRGVATLAGVGVGLGLALIAVTLVLVLLYLPIVRIIDWRPLSYPCMVLGTWAVMLGLVLWVRHRRLSRGCRAGPARRLALAIWAGLFLALWGYTLAALGERPLLRTALLRRGYGVARTFDLITWAMDFDSDGYLSFFGGGDCAPFNPQVHPGAVEVPGNGVDDNCFGGDLSAEQLRAPLRRFDAPLPPQLKGKKLCLVLITLDGLRADHVGLYGYKKPTTPNLDKFGREAVVFERAYSQAPSTRYSIPSFLTSKYSSQVPREATLDLPRPILHEALLMPEVLKKAGYRTGAVLSYQVFHRSWRLDQGFDFYDNTQAGYYVGKGSPTWDKDQPYVLVDVASKFLETVKDQPFFLWVHIFEPHPPFVHRTEPMDFGSNDEGIYNGELRFGDEKLGQLLSVLRRHPAWERMVVALSSDHGRGLGEHGMSTHGYDLFGENLQVPLLFRVPGIKPRRIKNPAALIDLLPTFVNLAGIRDRFDFEGESLVPAIVEGVEPPPDRPIFAEVQVGFQYSHVINAITTRDYKLIYDVTYNTYQLFDLRTDPREKQNVADRQPAELKRLRGLLYKVMERATLPAIDEEIRSSLVSRTPAMPGIQRVNFGNEIQFLGFELTPERPSPGEIFTISWYVQALSHIKQDNKFIVRLQGSKGGFFDAKHVPCKGLYPTTKWPKGQIVRDRQYIRLPPPVQEWGVWIGFGTGHQILKPIAPLKLVNTAVLVGKFSTY